ncbi:MAG: phosphotransferase [Pirellula sp.]
MLNSAVRRELAIRTNQAVGTPFAHCEMEVVESKGFSNTIIYRFSNGTGAYAIRSWPSQAASRDKIGFWIACNLEFEQECAPFPKLHRWVQHDTGSDTVLRLGDQFWTLADWVQGHPLKLQDTGLETLEHLGAVLGAIHMNTQRMSERELKGIQIVKSSPTILERLAFLDGLTYDVLRVVPSDHFYDTRGIKDKVVGSLTKLLEKKGEWQRFLGACAKRLRNCHWIVRDLWYENVLVDSNSRFVSIVDLGAARIDWPGLDFVRLFDSVIGNAPRLAGGSGQEWWGKALAAYSNVHPTHSIDSLDECMLLGEITTSLSIAQWVQWIAESRFPMQNQDMCERIASRLAELCSRFAPD